MSDEIIRYGQIRSFVLRPKSFISFQNIDYNLKENEILLPGSILFEDEGGYFETLTPRKYNPYILYPNTFYNTEPSRSITYLDKHISIHGPCKRLRQHITGMWNNLLPSYRSLRFLNRNDCTWEFIRTIIKNYTQKNVTIIQLKEQLIKICTHYPDQRSIIKALLLSGKKFIVKYLERGEKTWQDVINSSEYYITDIDLVLFCKQYDIPLVVLGGWSLRFVKSKSIYFKSVKNTTECYIVRQPAFRPHRTPIFELITKNKKIKFKISTLPKQFHKIMYENVFEGDIKDFITKYIRYKN